MQRLFYRDLLPVEVTELGLVSTDNFFFDKVGLSQKKICSFKFNSVAKFHCQITVTKVCELSRYNTNI